ncbi:MAG: ribonuclease Z [Candidatus Dadabacteria bacterium]|nr:ribonuclease Z [Candidatus Dadabacteria bacterium]MCZ6554896.1 ribonuclease Z [Candidatus Dadabacteria bacterium]
MKLTILGSGTCIPNSKRGSSGYLLETPKSKILLDCGSGTTWKLEKIGIDYLEIDHIFFSHLHPDHTGDLVPFLFATKYSHIKKREKPLFLWGGKGFNNFFKALKKAYGNWIVPVGLNFDELKGGSDHFQDFKITATKTRHIESSLAYKIEAEGKSIVYSGDTDYSESLINLSVNTELLIIECALPNELAKISGHLTPGEVIKTINESKPKKVVVTHLYSECDEENVIETIRSNVDAEVLEAQDLLEVSI